MSSVQIKGYKQGELSANVVWEKGEGFVVTVHNPSEGGPRRKSYADEKTATAAAKRFIKTRTLDEDEAAAGPAITTSSMGPGALYAPKVMGTVSRFREFDKDRFDQSFMKKMKKHLNESEIDDPVYRAGYYASNENGSKPKNPYEKGTEENKKWSKGYKDREFDRENFEPSYIVDEAVSDFDSIKVGSRVTILTPQKQERTGRAVMKNRDQDVWVLDMGGPHGRPGIADRKNFVKVSGSKKLSEGLFKHVAGLLDRATRPSDEELRAAGSDPEKTRQHYADVDAGKAKRKFFVGNESADADLEAAYNSGLKAGEASAHKDQGTVSHERNWFRKFKSVKKDRADELQKKWDDGYRENSGAGRKPEYFK